MTGHSLCGHSSELLRLSGASRQSSQPSISPSIALSTGSGTSGMLLANSGSGHFRSTNGMPSTSLRPSSRMNGHPSFVSPQKQQTPKYSLAQTLTCSQSFDNIFPWTFQRLRPPPSPLRGTQARSCRSSSLKCFSHSISLSISYSPYAVKSYKVFEVINDSATI